MFELISPPKCLQQPLNVPSKIMMGPGPSNMPNRVANAMSNPILGHLHPETLKIMDDIKEGCQYIFQTKNPVTLCVSASGHGAMEMVICNLVEENDIILFGITGLWGHRAADMARRNGGDVRFVEATPGKTLTLEQIESALKLHQPMLFFLVQGESSTGILQPIEGIGELCRKYNCLLAVDTVASLGGTQFYADKWLVDVFYTGSQKVFGGPPGLTPISFGARALEKVAKRKTPIKVYYFDINLVGDYWNCFGRPRIYHHTVSATLLYGVRESLAIFCEEGIEASIRRHEQCSERLQKGILSMGLEMYVEKSKDRLPTVNAIRVPKNIEWLKVAQHAMKNHWVEISGGLGPSAGQVFRIGLMGVNATNEKVDLILKVLEESIRYSSNL